MAEPTTAVSNAPSRTIFAPFFKARWQNMQNIVNDSVFYDLVPEPYLTYYQAFIRQWTQWSQGFVPALHRQDFFSTGMGYTVCDIFARECMNGGFRFASDDSALKAFIEKWAANDLNNIFNKMFFFSNAGGNAFLSLTPIDGDAFPSVIPINRLYFQIGRHGEVTEATIFNRFTAGETAYYAREHRIMYRGRPYYRVELAEGTIVTCPSFSTSRIQTVPEKIEMQWRYAYGTIEPGVWYELPFKTIGLYNVRNKSVAVALSDLPGYSDSSLHTALDILYSIDYNYTQGQLDQYLGKSRAIIPKQYQTATVRGKPLVVNGQSFIEALNQRAPELLDTFYNEIESGDINGTPVRPTFMQPDLRGEAHKYIRDADLELLSSKVGLSSSTLANHLSYNTSKTATEVRSEQDTTETSVNNKRALASKAINAMLADTARFYGFRSRVEIEWGRAGVNTSTENQELLEDYRAGTLPIRHYLKRRWPDLSEEEIEQMAQEIEAEKQQQMSFGMPEYTEDYRT